MNSREITEADFINLAADMVGKGLLKTGQSNFELAKEYAQQSQPSGMSAEEVKEIAENHFKNTTWLEGTQEQDTKFGFRIGYMKAMKDFAIQNPSTASPAGAAEGASEGMAEALAKFFAKECKVGDPLLSIIDSIYDDWKLVYDKLRIETSFSEAAIQANKFVIEKYASLSSPGSGWVKVDYSKPETLPEFGLDVFVYAPEEKDPFIIDHCFKGSDGNIYWDWCKNPDTHKPTVTHWRPLPTPPGE